MKRTAPLTLGLLLAVALFAGRSSPTRAHGIGLPQAINVNNGPYLISVWTDPDPLREDETHVVVAVMDPATRAPLVTGHTVSVRLDDLSGEHPPVTQPALPGNSANQLLYVVEFNDLVRAGQWQATIIVDGPQGTAAEVTFPLEIIATRGFNWMWLGIGGLGIAVVAWLLLSARPAASSGSPRPARRGRPAPPEVANRNAASMHHESAESAPPP
jgi:hypothetical protein